MGASSSPWIVCSANRNGGGGRPLNSVVSHHVTHVRDLIPRHRTDFERLDQLLKLDDAAVDECLEGLLVWLQDRNYPVARPIAEYLVNRGAVVVPHIREILRGTDRYWQYDVLVAVVDRWPKQLVAELQPELSRLAHLGLDDGREVDIRALRLLVQHRLGDRDEINRLLTFKLTGAKGILNELQTIDQMARRDG